MKKTLIVLIIIIFLIVVAQRYKNNHNETTIPKNDVVNVSEKDTSNESGDYEYSLKTSDGLERTYLIHLPTDYNKNESYPLVMAFHGGFGTGQHLANQTGLSSLADREGFMVVYPDGAENPRAGIQTWNAGNCCGFASRNNIDDVGFVRQLVGVLESNYNVDKTRIFATGMSNGAMLTNRLACEASDIFKAVAPVAGTIQIDECKPKNPVPILMVHGTSDLIVPFDGGVGNDSVTKNNMFVSVPQALKDWSVRNGCDDKEVVKLVASSKTEDVTTDKIEYTNCSASTILYQVNGGGHAWPGGKANRAQESDEPTQSFSASEIIWKFFNSI